MLINNIEKAYHLVDEVDRREGMTAYEGYHNTMRKLSHKYGFGFVQVCAAFSALSPSNDYIGNLRSLVSVMEGVKNEVAISDVIVSTYNACKIRAHKYLTGEADFLMETEGPKTRAFYHNIVKPSDGRYVTIDGHMFSLYSGQRMTMKAVATLKFNYKKVSDDFKKVANRHGLIPNQLQAMLWFTWKRIHNIIYDGQVDFLKDDHWGILIDIDTITPYDKSI